MTGPFHHRRWYQFSLRTLFVVVTFLCLGPGGYVAFEQHKSRQGTAALEALERLGGHIGFDRYEKDEIPVRSPAVRFLLGDDRYAHATVVSFVNRGTPFQATDRDLAHLAILSNLVYLDLSNTRVTDAGLAHLVSLTKLESLSLCGTQITDDGLPYVTRLNTLAHLNLRHTRVTDDGLAHLSELKSLGNLYLSDTQVGDAGLAHLRGLPQLCGVTLDRTKVSEVGAMQALMIESLTFLFLDDITVTEEDAKRLEQVRPDVNIVYRHSTGDDAPLVRKQAGEETSMNLKSLVRE